MILQQPFAICRSSTGFNYYSPISINAAQVPSTQTDFPVLVIQTDNRFKTVGNGGHVLNSSGFDIRPYTDSTLSTAITGYELERYNGSTGEVVMWVKVSSLSSSTTPFVLAYGNSSLTTDGSSTTTWSNSFLGVYHFTDGTTLNVNSATGSNNGTNHSATATAGKIDGAAALLSVGSQYIDCGTGINPTAITISAWFNPTTLNPAYTGLVVRKNASNVNYAQILIKSTGKLACFVYANADVSYDGTGSNTLSLSTTYYVTMSYSSSAGLNTFLNGSSDHTTVAANGNLVTTASTLDIGRDPITAGRDFNGWIDEVRVASVARSSDWGTTEYNNQNAPGTFETLGTEVPL